MGDLPADGEWIAAPCDKPEAADSGGSLGSRAELRLWLTERVCCGSLKERADALPSYRRLSQEPWPKAPVEKGEK